MWNLNDSPDQTMEYESDEGITVRSESNSISSALLVVEDGNSSEEDGEKGKKKKSNNTPGKIFGFSIKDHNLESPVVTRQFFPVDNESTNFPRAQWAGIKFCESEPPLVNGLVGNKIDVLQQQPIKKSRRGPRSRSSQYRGVTFYRRTGRWESHIWDCGKQVYLGGFDTAHAAARYCGETQGFGMCDTVHMIGQQSNSGERRRT